MTPVLPEDSLLQYRGTVVFMGRLYTYYWLGFMDNVWNVESIVFKVWKARAVYGRSKHNLWTYILKGWKAKAVYCHNEHNPWTYILKY